MVNPQVPFFEAPRSTDQEKNHAGRNVIRCRHWLKSVLCSGLMGLSACATVSSAAMSEPAVIAPSPVKDAKGQGGGEGHQNSKPRPKAKQKSDAEIEIEKKAKSQDRPPLLPEPVAMEAKGAAR